MFDNDVRFLEQFRYLYNKDHILAHKKSIYHKAEVMKSDECGCFHCLQIFSPNAIRHWTDTSQEEHTALCPKCGIDSVIGSSSGFPITKDFLYKMQKYWFGKL